MDLDEDKNAAYINKPYLLPGFQETKKDLTDIECIEMFGKIVNWQY